MATENFTRSTIKKQLAQNSGQVSITGKGGGYQFINGLTDQPLMGPPVDSSLLSIPQSINDPRLTQRALDLVRGFYEGTNVPPALVEALASVAAYTSVTNGIPVTSLITKDGLSDEMIRAYNQFRARGTQIGNFVASSIPSWTNNPALRGSVRAALVDT
jgi:hypothetical protein